jgi:hypothetical protein
MTTPIPQYSSIFWDPTNHEYYTTRNNTPSGPGRITKDPTNGETFNHLINRLPSSGIRDREPKSGSKSPQYVLVEKGDSEWSIAQHYAKAGKGGQVWGNDVVPDNRQFSNPNLIYPGDIVVINPSSDLRSVKAGSAPTHARSSPTAEWIQGKIWAAMVSTNSKSRLEAVLNAYANAADSQATFDAVKRIVGDHILNVGTIEPLIQTYLKSLRDKQVPRQPWGRTWTKTSDKFWLQAAALLRTYLHSNSKLGKGFSNYKKYGIST